MKKEGKNYLNDFQNSYDLDEKVNFQYIKRILESKKKSDQAKISAFDEYTFVGYPNESKNGHYMRLNTQFCISFFLYKYCLLFH